MMNTKKLIVLAVFLAVTVGVIFLVNICSNRKPSEESLQFFPDVSEKTIGAVLLKDASDNVKLQRKGDAWVMIPKQAIIAAAPSQENKVAGLSRAMGTDTGTAAVVKPPAGLAAAEFPADSGCIAQLVDNVVKLKKNILVSENPAKQATFEVDAAHGSRIEVFDIAGKSLGAVFLGKNGTDYSSNYFRPEKSNAVYLVQESTRGAFSADHKRWTDKSIMKFDKHTVKQIAIAKKSVSTIVIARGDSATKGWRILEPARKPGDTNKLDSNKVDELLVSISNLQAAEYEDSAYTDSATGLADPSIMVTVNFMSGTVRTLAIGNKKPEQNKFWVRVPEKQYVYLINDYDQKKIDKKPEDFEQQTATLPAKAAVPVKPGKILNPPMPEKYRKALEEIKKKNKK
ncbi:MAG: DUF4340 domain-containing protein [Chitinispirillaceae bacterium]|jgi:hypothetical protein